MCVCTQCVCVSLQSHMCKSVHVCVSVHVVAVKRNLRCLPSTLSERVLLCCSVSVDARGAGLPAPRNSPASTSISSRDYRQSHSMSVFPTVSRGSNSSFPHFHSKPLYTPRHHLSPIFTFFIKMPGDCKIQSTLGEGGARI